MKRDVVLHDTWGQTCQPDVLPNNVFKTHHLKNTLIAEIRPAKILTMDEFDR